MSRRQYPMPPWLSSAAPNDRVEITSQPEEVPRQLHLQDTEITHERQTQTTTAIKHQDGPQEQVTPVSSVRNPYSTEGNTLTPPPLFSARTLQQDHIHFTPSPSSPTDHSRRAASASAQVPASAPPPPTTNSKTADKDAQATLAYYQSKCQQLEERVQQLELQQQSPQDEDDAAHIQVLETAIEQVCTAVHRVCTERDLPGCPDRENISIASLIGAINSLASLPDSFPATPPSPPLSGSLTVEFHELLELFRYLVQVVYQYLLSIQDRLDPSRLGKLQVLDDTNKSEWENKEDAMLWAVVGCVLAGRGRSLEVIRKKLDPLLERVPRAGAEKQAAKELRDMLLEASKEDLNVGA